jgi:mannosyltransferase OCH1-like enzyme
VTDHEILLTGKGAHPFRFAPPPGPELELEIPRTLHMVWIGSPIPAKYLVNVQAFAEHNPTWTVKLWGDANRPNASDGMQNRDLYEVETNVAAKVDLLRYEIIHQEGGVYLDADTLSLGPGSLERMTHAFLTVSGPPWFNTGNAQFGFAAGSEFLAYVIRNARDPRVRAFRGDDNIPARTGPTLLTTCALSFGDMRIVHPNGRELLAKVHHCADKNW